MASHHIKNSILERKASVADFAAEALHILKQFAA
jgi:hypothetical protein